MSSMSLFASKVAVTMTTTTTTVSSSSSSSSSSPSSPTTSKSTISYGSEPLPTSDPLSMNIENGNGSTLSTSSSSTSIHKSFFTSFYYEHCFYCIPMLGWFTFSALLSTYNKLVFGEHGKIHFPCPLFMTSIHFLTQWAVSTMLCYIWPIYFGTNRVRRDMNWKTWASISIPCGLVTSGDVGLSNLSMVSISLTFYTMIKASTPIFVLFWAWLFGIERITWTLILVVVIIAFGEYLTCLGEAAGTFQLHGFILCLCASILSGARWTLVQLKLQSLEPPLKTTVVTMRLLAPSMFFSLLIISMAIEQPWIKLAEYSMLQGVETLALGLLGAFFAINMVLFEFYLIMHASALILMIGGVLKEMLTIVVGVLFFKDPINGTNLTGCFVVFLGVVLYKISFHLNKEKKHHHHHQHRPKRGSTSLDDSMSSSTSSRHGGGIHDNGTHSSVPSTPNKRSSPVRERLQATANTTLDLQSDHERTGLFQSLSKSSDDDDIMNGDGSERQHQRTRGVYRSNSSKTHHQQQQQQDSGIEMRRSGSSNSDDRSPLPNFD